MNKTIYLDAGHGGTDAGAVNGYHYEKNDNLNMAKAVKNLLVKQGHTVIMTREDDIFVSLADRTKKANAAGADIFVSIHRNSFTNITANGTEIWVYTTAGAVDVGAATEVLERLAAVGIQCNRGVKKGNYHVLRESNMTSMLIELGFISNTIDNQLLATYFDAYAEAMAQGICAALGVEYSTGNNTNEAEDFIYRVQVGAFGVKANAEAFLAKVREMGLEAFLVAQDTAKAE